MRRGPRILARVVSLFLVMTLFCGTLLTPSTITKAAEIEKTNRSYEIAVVFDNSGSMYKDEAWCRAKYAMEIFAAMLDYKDGDKLKIFPMWEVTTDGTSKSGGSYSPIQVESKGDIEKIANLYTPKAGDTPYAPVNEAYEYLQKTSATDKWLIVLTDGEFNQEARTDQIQKVAAAELQKRLTGLASNDIKIQYLGFGKAPELQQDESKGFYAKKSTDTSLKDDLINICNAIFQRSVLPANRLDGKTLELDLSMKNLIVFVQGSDAKVESLKNAKGTKVECTLDSGQRKYSTISAGGDYENAKPDTSLAGQVVTFGRCAAGKYTLTYSSEVAPQIFYEPDVDIEVTLTNAEGQKVDGTSGKLVAGEYTITSKIIDKKTKQDVTKHELMGNDVKVKTIVKPESGEKKELGNPCTVKLEPDKKTEIVVEGTYLKDYKISTKDNPDLDWLKNIQVVEPSVDIDLNAEVLQSNSWYKIKDHDSWKPIKATVKIEGKKATDEQLDKMELKIKTQKGVSYRYEPIKGESAFYIYLGQDKDGKYVEPKTGKYKMDISAVFTDKFDTENYSNMEKLSFDIQIYDKIWVWLGWLLLFLILLTIWLLIMTKKVLPKKIGKDTGNFETLSAGELGGNYVGVEYKRKAQSLKITTSGAVDFDEKCTATFKLKPVDNRFKKSRDRRIKIVGINSNCITVSINNTEYVKNSKGTWVKGTSVDAQNPPPIGHEAKNPIFELVRGSDASVDATLTCRVKNIK